MFHGVPLRHVGLQLVCPLLLSQKRCIGNVVLQALEGSLHPPLNIIASQDLDDLALGGDEAKLFWTEM